MNTQSRGSKPAASRQALFALTSLAALGLSACSAATDSDEVTLQLFTHDSFAAFLLEDAPELLEEFTTQTGTQVRVLVAEDDTSLANQLVLTKNSPIADVVFGIDTNTAGRVTGQDVLIAHRPEALGSAEEAFLLPAGEGAELLTPISHGDVALNIDTEWFAAAGLAEPQTLADLLKEEYRGLAVVTNPTTSTPGLAFLFATIAEFGGEGWQQYWREFLGNDQKIAAGWTEAYYTDFTRAGGDRPIVLSYASSPAFDADTASLDLTAYRQVEYAGIIKGTRYEDEARALIDFLFSAEFQSSIHAYYVFPVNSAATVPAEWEERVSIPENPLSLAPSLLEQNRQEWLLEWAEIAGGR